MTTQDTKLAWLQQVLGVGADDGDAPAESGKARKNAFTEVLSSAENKLMRLFSTTKTPADGDTGLDTTRIKGDLTYQRRALENAASITDEGERQAAIDRINRRIDEIQAHANALETARKAVMGDSKKAPTDAQKNKIYQQALEDFYGLKLSVPLLMSNTHLDRVFDMMGTMPKGQTGHDKLKKLEYTRDKGWKGSGAATSSPTATTGGATGTPVSLPPRSTSTNGARRRSGSPRSMRSPGSSATTRPPAWPRKSPSSCSRRPEPIRRHGVQGSKARSASPVAARTTA